MTEKKDKDELLQKEQEALQIGVENLVKQEDQVRLVQLADKLDADGIRFVDLVEGDLLKALEGKGDTATFEFQVKKLEALQNYLTQRVGAFEGKQKTLFDNDQNTLFPKDQKTLLQKINSAVGRDIKKIKKYQELGGAEKVGQLQILKMNEKAKSILDFVASLKGVTTDPEMEKLLVQEKEVQNLMAGSMKGKKAMDSYVALGRLESAIAELETMAKAYQASKETLKTTGTDIDIAKLESQLESKMPKVKQELYEDEYKNALTGKKEKEGSQISQKFHEKIKPVLEKAGRLSALFNFTFSYVESADNTLDTKLEALRMVVTTLEERKKAAGDFPKELEDLSKEIIRAVGTADKPAEDSPEMKVKTLIALRQKAEELKKSLFEKYESGDISPDKLREQLQGIKLHYREVERQEVLVLGNVIKQSAKKNVENAIQKGGSELQKVVELNAFITSLEGMKATLEGEIVTIDVNKAKQNEAIEQTRFLQLKIERIDAMIARAKAQKEYFEKLHPTEKSEAKIDAVKQSLQAAYDSRLPTGKKTLWFHFREGMKRYYGLPILAGIGALATGNPLVAALAIYRPLADIRRRFKEGSWAATTDARIGKISTETVKGNQALENIMAQYESGKTSLFGDYFDRWKAIRSQQHIQFQKPKVDEVYDKLAEKGQSHIDRLQGLSKEFWSINFVGRTRRRLAYWRHGISEILGDKRFLEGKNKDFESITKTLGQKFGLQMLRLEALRNKRNIKDGDINAILGSLAQLLEQEEGFNSLEPEQKVESAILFLQKLSDEDLKKHTKSITRPGFMSAPESEIKKIEGARKEAESLMKTEFENYPGYPVKVGEVLRKHGVRYEYGFDRYKGDIRLWSQLNFDPFFTRVVSRQVEAFGAFLKAQGRSHEYDFQVRDLGLFRGMNGSVTALDFRDMWKAYSKDKNTQKINIRDFLHSVEYIGINKKYIASEKTKTPSAEDEAEKKLFNEWKEDAKKIEKFTQAKEAAKNSALSNLKTTFQAAADGLTKKVTDNNTKSWDAIVSEIMTPRENEKFRELRVALQDYALAALTPLIQFAGDGADKYKSLLESLGETKQPTKVDVNTLAKKLLERFRFKAGDEVRPIQEYWSWKSNALAFSNNQTISLIPSWEVDKGGELKEIVKKAQTVVSNSEAVSGMISSFLNS